MKEGKKQRNRKENQSQTNKILYWVEGTVVEYTLCLFWAPGFDPQHQVNKFQYWAEEKAQWVKTLAAKTDYLSSIPKSHILLQTDL